MSSGAAVDLYWLPLGAGGHSVRMNGRVFEAVAARLQRRKVCDLYHSALEVRLPAEGRFVIEQAPIPNARGAERGVVAEGPVGARWAARTRIFRYEVRRWRNGVIPDIDEAVASPVRLTDDAVVARRLWNAVPEIPTQVWGRDELGAGEMWNSNSITAWLITRSGLPTEQIPLPANGRAPGWHAGIVAARRNAVSGTVERGGV
jgi:hypothetical protein